jgi:dolichol-phosphate mannosyltransferase
MKRQDSPTMPLEKTGMTEQLSISICVPALNEEKSIMEAVHDLFQTLSAYMYKIEVIIVDDNSIDGTLELASQLAKEYSQLKVIHHEKRMGIGACYRDALAIARENYFTWFPADHENSAEEFIRCVPYLSPNTIVSCYHRGQDCRFIMRRWVSHIYTWVLNKYFHLDLKYYNGLTVFPTSIVRSFPLVANGFVFTAENLIKSIKCGYKIVELSAPLRKRVYGRSNAFTLSSAKQIIKDVFLIFCERKKQVLAKKRLDEVRYDKK